MTRLSALALTLTATLVSAQSDRPNVVFVLADDLGWAELGCYGQEIIRTPTLDQLAADGMRFTAHYSGSPVCAPSRCVLMTGKHTGISYIRGNREGGGWGPDEPEGQHALAAEEVTLAELLRGRGYATGVVGKWGLGPPGSEGHPLNQGFDFFYGYICQRVAHNYYPTHLWRNHDVDVLDGNRYFKAHQKLAEAPEDPAVFERYATEVYAPDRMLDEALGFMRRSAAQEQPFFLYYPTPVPHVALQVPDDSLAEYSGELDEGPYLGQRGYLPHPEPRAAYAAMVTRMDRDIGRIIAELDELGVAENTIVVFTSDNGPTFNGGTDSDYFESSGPYRGRKCSVYEGGLRVPMIVRWPGHVARGSTSAHVSAFIDHLPTIAELCGAEVPGELPGLSYAKELRGEDDQPAHEWLYWEYPEVDGQQALRHGSWKLVRRGLRRGEPRIELYDLASDEGESHDLAAERPDVVERLLRISRAARRPSELFPLPVLDGEYVGAADIQQLWDYSDPEASAQRFEQLALQLEHRPDLHAQVRTQLARTLGMRGRFDEAHALLDDGEASLADTMSGAGVRVWLERGRVLNSSGRQDEARALFSRALEAGQARAGAGAHAVDAAHMLGIVCPGEQGLAWSQVGIGLAQASSDPDVRRWLGPLYNNAGLTLLELERYEQALASYEAGRACRESRGDDTFTARWCIAHTLRRMGRTEEALEHQHELLTERQDDGFVNEELVECLVSLGRLEEARAYAVVAAELLEPISWVERSRIVRMQELSR